MYICIFFMVNIWGPLVESKDIYTVGHMNWMINWGVP